MHLCKEKIDKVGGKLITTESTKRTEKNPGKNLAKVYGPQLYCLRLDLRKAYEIKKSVGTMVSTLFHCSNEENLKFAQHHDLVCRWLCTATLGFDRDPQ